MADAIKLPAAPGRIDVAFQLGDRMIDGVVIRPILFTGLVECIQSAQTMTQPKSFEARLRRLRMVKQVTYYNGTTTVPMAANDVPNFSIPAAKAIIAGLDADEGKAGKIIREGNGVDQSIIYELGTPIPVQGKAPITELEFVAKTYGDIEDIMAADLVLQQTSLMISMIAKPLGTTLSLLPSWAVAQISVADGVTMSRAVLPRFLGSPDES